MAGDAQDYLKHEFGSRTLSGPARVLIPLIASLWSLFQLAIAKAILLDSIWVVSIHLAFAMALVYLSFPAVKSERWVRRIPGTFSFLTRTRSIPAADLLLAVCAVIASLYLAMDFEGIGQRLGTPIARDLVLSLIHI